MNHFNVFMFFILGDALGRCRDDVEEQKPIYTILSSVHVAKTGLMMLIDAPKGQYRFNEARTAGMALVKTLTRIQEESGGSPAPTEAMEPVLAAEFQRQITAFSNSLQLELGRAPVFWVNRKGMFDTSGMIREASLHYADGVIDRLPKEAISDTDHAGRCLAFSLGTASGFHIARAVEAVMKKYMTACGCPTPTESQRNWGFYIKSLEDHGASAKVTAHLKQIKDLHRNPLIHPEVHLGVGEAVTLFSICTSVIQAMVVDMETKSATPDPEIVAMAPQEGV